MARDPEIRELLRRQFALVVEAEKLLTKLEDQKELLRTFIGDGADTEGVKGEPGGD